MGVEVLETSILDGNSRKHDGSSRIECGCEVVVNHSRPSRSRRREQETACCRVCIDGIDRIATHILAFEDEGPIWFDGNYSEFEAYRKKQLGADAEPKRMKYKKIAK